MLAEFSELWSEVDEIWDRHQDTLPFEGYVSANYLSVYNSLAQLRGKVSTVLEWGSGLGVVSIMASRMGFDAYGIEAESVLLEYSEEFAERYGPATRFAHGSFIPNDFVWNPGDGEEVNRTVIDMPAAYEQFDMELDEFDLVYAYPWPEERDLYHNILRDFGRRDVLMLIYDGREGISLFQIDHR